MEIYEIILLIISIISISILFSSGLQNYTYIYISGSLFLAYVFIIPFFNHTPALYVTAIVPFLVFLPILYKFVMMGKNDPSTQYFKIFGLKSNAGIMLFTIYTTAIGKYFEAGWGVFFIFLSLMAHYCRTFEGNSHKKLFEVFGSIAFLLYLFYIYLYMIILGWDISFENYMFSLRANVGYFIFVILFFVANYSKMGLFVGETKGNSIFLFLCILFAISIITRNPEIVPILRENQIFKEIIPLISVSVITLSPILMGIYAYKSK